MFETLHYTIRIFREHENINEQKKGTIEFNILLFVFSFSLLSLIDPKLTLIDTYFENIYTYFILKKHYTGPF